MDLQYNLRLQKIEAVLDRWLPGKPDSAWGAEVFPGPGAVPESGMFHSLIQPGRDLLSRGGKRWRPLFMILVCETLGGGDAALPLSPLVEFSHNASLIHDDIEDNSRERRGKPAVHLLYGTDTAINSGSFLYFLALNCIDTWAESFESSAAKTQAAIVKSDDNAKNTLYSLWGQYMRRLHLGQAMDIGWHRDFSSLPCIEDYFTMCSLKTGCLSRFAAVLGVFAAARVNAKAAEKEKNLSLIMGEAAENLGVGFQILDDVKNLSGGIPGKQLGDDIAEGKKSLPVLLYIHRYPEKRDFVSACFITAAAEGAGSPKVHELIQILEETGILTEAKEQGLAFITQGRKKLDSVHDTGIFPMIEEGRRLLDGIFELIS